MLVVLAGEWAAGTQRFTGPGESLFAARDADGTLLGIGGVTRDPHAAALRMRRSYVRPEARRRSVGRALAAAAAAHARVSGAAPLRLRAPPGAFSFWEACGFVPVEDATATHVLRPG